MLEQDAIQIYVRTHLTLSKLMSTMLATIIEFQSI